MSSIKKKKKPIANKAKGKKPNIKLCVVGRNMNIEEIEIAPEVSEDISEEVVGSEHNIKPFLKWAGGKLRLVDTLKKKFPKNGTRYIEPFLGAGSVALNVMYPEYIVNDFNDDLMSVWSLLKNDGVDFVNEAKKLFVAKNNNPDTFYEFRTEFNTTKDKYRKAMLFIYLNRHCFNGLCRYNGSGEFNVPFGKYTKPYFPEKEFNGCLDVVKKFQIHNKDFREIFEMVKSGDVVYCDPPYMPLSASANFSDYAEAGFGLKDQIDLAKCAEAAAEKGATVVISNHYNWYSKQIYQDLHNGKVSKIEVSRTISAKTDKRDPVEEIVAVFQKQKNVQSA